jgi:prepilin-type N-terminal cleavage/methylation domain-containing protein
LRIEQPSRSELGFSMTELLVTVAIFSAALLGLGLAGVQTSHLLQVSDTHTDGFVALQWQAETLRNQGHDAVQGGSTSVMGYEVSWDVRGTNPKRVMLTAERDAPQRRRSMVDSLVIHLSPQR